MESKPQNYWQPQAEQMFAIALLLVILQQGRMGLTSALSAGQRADTSYLDPIKVEDAPAEAIRLAAAELALRVSEERRRRDIGLDNTPNLKYERMTGKIGVQPQTFANHISLIKVESCRKQTF